MAQEIKLALKVEGKDEYLADVAEVTESVEELKELLEQVDKLLQKIGGRC